MRYFLFIDESGTPHVENVHANFDVFVLCGILIEEKQYNFLDNHFCQLKETFFNKKDVHFHFHKMRNKEGAFKLFQDEGTLTLFKAALQQSLMNVDFKIISVIIDKPNYREQYPSKNLAYEEALTFICERCTLYFKKKNFRKMPQLLIYLERRNKNNDNAIRKYYTNLITKGNRFYSKEELCSVCPEKIQFREKKHNINGLQAADILAYPIARKHISPKSEHFLYDLILEKFYRSNNGTINGYGLKVYPIKR